MNAYADEGRIVSVDQFARSGDVLIGIVSQVTTIFFAGHLHKPETVVYVRYGQPMVGFGVISTARNL